MSSAAEAEIGALFINYPEAVQARHTLEFLGHHQPQTPMKMDNTESLGVIIKSMDMK